MAISSALNALVISAIQTCIHVALCPEFTSFFKNYEASFQKSDLNTEQIFSQMLVFSISTQNDFIPTQSNTKRPQHFWSRYQHFCRSGRLPSYVKDKTSVPKLHKVEKKRRCSEINGPRHSNLPFQKPSFGVHLLGRTSVSFLPYAWTS